MVAEAILPIQDDGTISGITTGSGGSNSGFTASATKPNTTNWPVGGLWLDLSTLPATTTWRVWNGYAFEPEPAGETVLGELLLADDFSGTNGAAWDGSKWGLGSAPLQGTGGGASLLSGQGVLAASNYGNFSGDSMISRRMLISGADDVNILLSFRFDSTDSYLMLHARHTENALDRKNGYALLISKPDDTFRIIEIATYVQSNLEDPVEFAYTEGVTYKARFRVVGTTLKAKVWVATDSEPGTWDIETTDSTYTSGVHGLSVAGGATNANPRRVFIDDVVVRAS